MLEDEGVQKTVETQRNGPLQEMVQKHLNTVIELKSNANTMSPITRFPSEILAHIFIHHVAAYHRKKSDDTSTVIYYPSPSKWIGIAHVCRHWRVVALDCAALWNHISVDIGRNWILESLIRSKQTPLFVGKGLDDKPLWKSDGGDTIKTLLLEMPRIQELQIGSGDALMYEANRPAQLLRKLAVSGFKQGNPKEEWPLFSHILYGNRAPLLQHLTMDSMPFQWRADFLLPNLKHLKLTNKYRYHSDRSWLQNRLADLLAALEAMPLLETLHLEYTLPESMPAVGRGSHIVKLPNLRSIKIRANSLSSANLLGYIEIPLNSTISVEGALEPLDAMQFLEYCATKYDEAGELQYLSLQWDYHSGWLGLELEPFDESGEMGYGSDSPKLKISATIPDEDPFNVVGSICRRLPVSNVKTLDLNGVEGITHTELCQVFETMPELHVLRVGRTPLVPLFNALHIQRWDPEGNHPTGRNKFFLPYLHTLDISRFHRRSNVDILSLITEHEFKKLVDFIMVRHEHGADIRYLVLEPSIVLDWNMISLLGAIADPREWAAVIASFRDEGEVYSESSDDHDM